MRFKQLLLLLTTIFCRIIAEAQPADNPFLPALPPSALTANIMKYGDIPVDLHTGVPDISIPIYEINTGQLKLPLSLNYHAAGFQVHELANNVGLGWVLNAEGIISQSVLGNLDNGSDYQNYGVNFPMRALSRTDINDYDTLYQLVSNTHDGAPDLFNYSFDGHTGRFIEGHSNDFVTMPQKNIKITRQSISGGSASRVYTWKITVENGTQYWFLDSAEISYSGHSRTNSLTWYLTHIISPNKADTIFFHYIPTGISDNPYESQSITSWRNGATGCYIGGACAYGTGAYLPISGPGVVEGMTHVTYGRQLYRIDFRNGSIEYKIAMNARSDYAASFAGVNIPRVDKVIVRDKNSNVIKVAHFSYDYFNSAATVSTKKRLMLSRVIFNTNFINPYTPDAQRYELEYNTSQDLPDRFSKAIDHWGNYNGATTNTTLIPTTTMPTSTGSTYVYFGADRDVHTGYKTANVIKKIIYPTGGWTEYEFESNDIPPVPLTHLVYRDSLYRFTYTYSGGTGCGSRAGDPFYVDPARFPSGINVDLQGSYNNYGGVMSHCRPFIAIRNGAGTTYADYDFASNAGHRGSSLILTVPQTFYVPAGEYIYPVACNHSGGSTDTPETTCDMNLHLYYDTPSLNIPVGGLRVKKVISHDQYTNTDNEKHYSYDRPGTPYSSGQVFHMPEYTGDNYYHETCYVSSGSYPLPFTSEFYGLNLSTNNVPSLGTGSIANYSYVTEYNGEHSLGGYSTYHFTNFDYAPPEGQIDQSWRRGLLLDRVDYDNHGNKKYKLANRYKFDTRPFVAYNGREVSYVGEPDPLAVPGIMPTCGSHYKIKPYRFPSEWIYVDTTYDTTYYSGGLVTNFKWFFYDNTNHKELTRLYTGLSDGSKSLLKMQYPSDYSSTSAGAYTELGTLVNMQNEHMHSYPIEKVEFKQDAGGSLFALNGKYIEWQHLSSGWNVPYKEYALRTISPISGFVMSNSVGTSIIKSSSYKLENMINEFDSRHNVIDMNNNQTNYAYLYAYNRQYMIAKFKNALQNQIAYCGFEAYEKGNWSFNQTNITTDPITGQYGYLMNSDISFSPASGAYSGSGPNCIVSYWKKGISNITVNGTSPTSTGNTVNSWTYYEHVINANSTVVVHDDGSGGISTIDELRLYPINAQAETYTYKPLIGITSQNDVNNTITYYDYDVLGRLELIRDKRKNIIKKIEYGVQVTE